MGPTLGGDWAALAAGVRVLGKHGWPPVFAFLYAGAWRAVSANRPYAFNSRMDKLIAVVMHLFTLLHVLFYS